MYIIQEQHRQLLCNMWFDYYKNDDLDVVKRFINVLKEKEPLKKYRIVKEVL